MSRDNILEAWNVGWFRLWQGTASGARAGSARGGAHRRPSCRHDVVFRSAIVIIRGVARSGTLPEICAGRKIEMPLDTHGTDQFSDFPARLSIDDAASRQNAVLAGISSFSPANDWG
jgi:hypothetical protein